MACIGGRAAGEGGRDLRDDVLAAADGTEPPRGSPRGDVHEEYHVPGR